jgi:hypothetical protein
MHKLIKKSLKNIVSANNETLFDTDGHQYISVQVVQDVSTVGALVFAGTVTVNISDNKFVRAAHLLSTGLKVQVSTSGTLPTPLAASTDYYVIVLDANEFKLATSAANAHAGTAIDLTAIGNLWQTFTAQAITPVVCASATDIAHATETFTAVAHGLTTGLKVQVSTSGVLPDGLVALTDYFVVRLTADTFQLSDTYAHAIAGTDIVPLADNGTGNQTFTAQAIANVVAYSTADIVADGDTFEKINHGYPTGLKVQVATSTTLPTGISGSTDYFVVAVDADTFQLSDTLAHALAGTDIINFTNTGTGLHTVTPVTLASATAKLEKSNDGVNFTDLVAAVNITADGSTWLEPTGHIVAAKYCRVTFAITSGILDATVYACLKGR